MPGKDLNSGDLTATNQLKVDLHPAPSFDVMVCSLRVPDFKARLDV